MTDIKDFHFHDLRHMALTRLSSKFTNILELAAISGHKELKMLQRYVHIKAEDLAKKMMLVFRINHLDEFMFTFILLMNIDYFLKLNL